MLIAIYIGMSGFRSVSGSSFGLFFVAGIVLFLLWLATKQRIIKISGCGGRSINIDARKLSKERTQELIDRVQLAKSVRMDYLSGK